MADDLVQDVILHWWEQRRRYSSERGASPQTFMRRVVEKKLLDISRRERAGKRRGERYAASLSEELGPDDGTTLEDMVPDDSPGTELGRAAEETELRLQVQRVFKLLSVRQQELALELSRGMKIAEISRQLNVPRSTLYDELARIQEMFRNEGLEEFLN